MMPKYIVSWNAGYGDSYKEVDAADEDEAVEQAYGKRKPKATLIIAL
jgi:hypothetical protein